MLCRNCKTKQIRRETGDYILTLLFAITAYGLNAFYDDLLQLLNKLFQGDLICRNQNTSLTDLEGLNILMILKKQELS